MPILPTFLSFGLLLASIGLPIQHQPGLLDRADALRAQGKPLEALEIYSEAIRLDPGDSEAYLKRAAVQSTLDHPERAEEDYARAIRASPRSAKTWSTRAEARFAADRFAEAIPDFDVAIGLDPYNDDLYFSRGCACLDSDRNEQAITDFTRALALALKDSNTVSNSYANRCNAYRNLKRYEEALADNERARQAGSDDEDTRADCLTHLKRYKEALAIFDQQLSPPEGDGSSDENRPNLFHQRAKTKIAMQDFTGAKADLAEAAKLRPTTTDEYGDISWYYILARRPIEAQAAARQAIAHGDADGWIHINLADACLIEGKTDEARDIYLHYVNEWVHPGKTGLQVIRQDFADIREAGMDLPGMKVIEAVLPREVHPPPAPPKPASNPVGIRFEMNGEPQAQPF